MWPFKKKQPECTPMSPELRAAFEEVDRQAELSISAEKHYWALLPVLFAQDTTTKPEKLVKRAMDLASQCAAAQEPPKEGMT